MPAMPPMPPLQNNNQQPPEPPILFPDLNIRQWTDAVDEVRRNPNLSPYKFRVRPSLGGDIEYIIEQHPNGYQCIVQQGPNRILSSRNYDDLVNPRFF